MSIGDRRINLGRVELRGQGVLTRWARMTAPSGSSNQARGCVPRQPRRLLDERYTPFDRLRTRMSWSKVARRLSPVQAAKPQHRFSAGAVDGDEFGFSRSGQFSVIDTD